MARRDRVEATAHRQLRDIDAPPPGPIPRSDHSGLGAPAAKTRPLFSFSTQGLVEFGEALERCRVKLEAFGVACERVRTTEGR